MHSSIVEKGEMEMVDKNMNKKIEDLHVRKKRILLGGGSEKVGKQHASGKFTARERIEKLLDKGSFREIGAFARHRCSSFGMEKIEAPADGVITGYGKIDGRNVMVFSHDFTVLGGTQAEVHSLKIVKIKDLAAQVGVPIIGINDSAGGRIQEGVDALGKGTAIFCRNVIYSGVIPQISAILGPCAGGAVYEPALTDFVFMTESIGYMFLTGPKVIKQVTGEDIQIQELGGTSVHCNTTGVAHFYTKTEEECFESIRRLLSFLPSNNKERPPVRHDGDPPDRENQELLEIVPIDFRKPYDVARIISEVVDNQYFYEVHKNWARNIVVGFGRMNGNPTGFIANQPRVLAGAIDINASDKAARFIRFCDAFNIPLITFVDTPAFLPGKNQEFGGIIRHGAKLLYAYAEATVPKITVILRKAYGGGYSAMGHRELGTDLVFAWPTAEIAIMGPEGAAEIIFRREIEAAEDPTQKRQEKMEAFRKHFGHPYIAASRGYVDDVIDPAKTREYLCFGLQLLLEKHQSLPPKKHGNIPL